MFEVYRDDAGDWRWRMKSLRGVVIAVSSESFKKRSAALTSIGRVQDQAKGASIVEAIA